MPTGIGFTPMISCRQINTTVCFVVGGGGGGFGWFGLVLGLG